MAQNEVATQKDNVDNAAVKDVAENQTNEATGEVSSEVPDPGTVCKPPEEAEARYNRLKLFNKVMHKSLEKFVDHARYRVICFHGETS